MQDCHKTKAELIAELDDLRRQVAELRAAAAPPGAEGDSPPDASAGELARHKAILQVAIECLPFDPQSVGPGHFGLEGIRQRVRQLGGQLTIDSQPGAGTAVRLAVPIVEQPSA